MCGDEAEEAADEQLAESLGLGFGGMFGAGFLRSGGGLENGDIIESGDEILETIDLMEAHFIDETEIDIGYILSNHGCWCPLLMGDTENVVKYVIKKKEDVVKLESDRIENLIPVISDSDVKNSEITPKTSIESPRLSVTNSKRASLKGARTATTQTSTRTTRTMELRKQKAQEAEQKRQLAANKRKSMTNRQSVTFKAPSTSASSTTGISDLGTINSITTANSAVRTSKRASHPPENPRTTKTNKNPPKNGYSRSQSGSRETIDASLESAEYVGRSASSVGTKIVRKAREQAGNGKTNVRKSTSMGLSLPGKNGTDLSAQRVRIKSTGSSSVQGTKSLNKI